MDLETNEVNEESERDHIARRIVKLEKDGHFKVVRELMLGEIESHYEELKTTSGDNLVRAQGKVQAIESLMNMFIMLKNHGDALEAKEREEQNG